MTPRQITHSDPPAWTGVEYSSCNPFNCDNTRLLLVKVDHFGLYDGDGHFLKDLPIAASHEPRWSRTDPELVYFIDGNKLAGYAVDADAWDAIPAFPEYVSISGKGEGDWSPSMSMALAGTKADGSVEVFVYSLKDGKGPTYTTPKPIDGLKITASNKAIVSYADGSGIWVLDSQPRKLASVDGHSCPTTYQGKDELLWCSAADPQVNKNALVMIDVETGVMEILADFSWSFAFHISAPLNQPWCIVSLDVPDKTAESLVMKIPFDTSLPKETICNPGSIYTGYNSQVKAAVSGDGSRVVGCSNFGKTDDPNYCDVWMISLPAVVDASNASGPIVTDKDTRIDYSSYVGKSEFVIKPQAKCPTCGSTIAGIDERKL